MKSYKILMMLFACLTITLVSCEKSADSDSDKDGNTDGTSHDVTSDYTWETSTEIAITLNGNSITCNSANVVISGSVATITAGGNYSVNGSLTNGQLIVNAGNNDLVRLILNNATITNASGAALLIESSLRTIVYLPSGTLNTITDGSTYTNAADDPNAAIFSKSDLTIFGEGSLLVNGKYGDGIASKDGLIIKSGLLTVNAVDDGIRGKDYLIMDGGTIRINCNGDGMVSDNEAGSAVGYIKIASGTIAIVAGGDGISAQTSIDVTGGDFDIKTGGGSTSAVSGDASAKGIKGLVSVSLAAGICNINAADDGIHSNNSVEIKSGTYSIATADDGLHADATLTVLTGNITITKSNEGFESHIITIQDGTISVVSSDDSFNATAGSRTESDDKSCIYIYGGHIVLNGSAGDPLDSNGSIVMTGGTVIIHGPSSQPEVGIDYNGSFNISGGFIVASGSNSNMTQAPSNSSSQNSLKLMFKTSLSASTLFHIQDASGNEVCTFKPLRKYQSIILSSSLLLKGTTYYVYKTGTSTGTDDNGLIVNGKYTPGSQVGSFTITNTVTALSNL